MCKKAGDPIIFSLISTKDRFKKEKRSKVISVFVIGFITVQGGDKLQFVRVVLSL